VKQSDLTIVTQCDAQWIPSHLRRFLKLAKRAMPEAQLCLALYTPGAAPIMDETGACADVWAMLDQVELLPLPATAELARDEYNTIRMGMGHLFGVDEYLYMDADVDVFADLSDIPGKSEKRLMWCQSPVMNADWPPIAKTFGYDMGVVANNGLLYVRGDLRKEYCEALDIVTNDMLTPQRTRGMMAFNVMLRKYPELSAMLEYIYGVIWWDGKTMVQNPAAGTAPAYAAAKTLHYCNDAGKAERAKRDERWVW